MLAEEVKPYDKARPKGEQVEAMFDSIAPAYDMMNTAMTFGMHRHWLKKSLKALTSTIDNSENISILDLATGTGDVAFSLAKLFPNASITGVDLSEGMLRIAGDKLLETHNEDSGRIKFQQGDCLNLSFEDSSFNLLSIAYGIRNFENLQKGFREFYRVLKEGGKCLILELSRPENKMVRAGYDLYSRSLIPFLGRIMSKDSRAYRYLPESIAAMPPRHKIEEMLKAAGFRKIVSKPLTLGVVTYFIAEK